ncbi:Hsp70 family chaperone [Penicillium verhagenii]|nr:Hsp70 family chaperone [Penicillium verhagenii]
MWSMLAPNSPNAKGNASIQDLLQIENSDTAIVRGALIAGLAGLGRIQESAEDGGFNPFPSRTEAISRTAGRYDGTAAYFDLDRKLRLTSRAGDTISDGKPMSFSFYKMTKVRSDISTDQASVPVVSICTREKKIAPEYIDDPSGRKATAFVWYDTNDLWEDIRRTVEFKLDLCDLNVPITRNNECNFNEDSHHCIGLHLIVPVPTFECSSY